MRHFKIFIVLTLSMILFTNCEKDLVHDHEDEDHAAAEGLVLYESGQEVVRYENGNVAGEITVRVGETTAPLAVQFMNDHAELFTPEEDHYSPGYEVADTTIARMTNVENDTWEFSVHGLKSGTTSVVIKIFHGEHADFVSKSIPIRVEDN